MSKETEALGIDPKKLAGLQDAGFTAPDVIGTVEGWRAWKVALTPPRFGGFPKLYSASENFYWAPRVKAAAECRKGCKDPDPTSDRHVPGTHCSCGFYSAKSLEHLRSMGYHTYDENGSNTRVVGQLANWGRVIEGGQGWRSEYAYPALLFIPFEAWRLAIPLQRAYGVPVKLLNLLDKNAVPDQARDLKSIEGLYENKTESEVV
jgi:hypothetical protein